MFGMGGNFNAHTCGSNIISVLHLGGVEFYIFLQGICTENWHIVENTDLINFYLKYFHLTCVLRYEKESQCDVFSPLLVSFLNGR